MNVASPISCVVPTLDGPVLEVLAGSSVPLTLSEIHRRSTRGALSGVSSVLRRLVSEGVVLAVPGGYLLNRDHVAVGAIDTLANLRSEFLARLRAEVASWSFPIHLVGIFGSFARRDGDARSDIDIVIVGEGCPDDVIDVLASRVLAWTGNHAQVVVLTRSDLRQLVTQREPIVAEWRRDLEVVHGDETLVGELLK